MKSQKIGYLASLSEDTVVNCGNNHSFYKIKMLESALSDFSENKEAWLGSHSRCHFGSTFQSQFKENKKIDIQKEAFSLDGIEAEIIDPKLNKPLKGKFRITFGLEFVPDEPQDLESQSPLDEIRKQMEQNG
jgi:hypothetical protein